ncbi:hypothetical protein LOTGIDRAFT_91939, partial [Lottia gigantea]
LYSEGVSAYDDAQWYQCSLFFQDAIKDYNFYKKSVVDCRLNCKHHGIEKRNDTNFSELMQSIMLRSECIRKCKQKTLGKDRAFGRSNEFIENDFQMRKPYEYLQYCYFKVNRMIDAASAAYTFYVLNSDNKNAVKNVQFYREKMKVRDSEFIDLELKPHKEYFIRAMMAYEDELWEEVIEEMENSLKEFYKEEERCRSECEGPLLATSHLEFYSAVAEHYLNVIKCQNTCEDKLSQVFPEGKDGLLAEHYHYLQFTYYKLYQADKASEAAASFLYIKPQDDIMLRNQKFFIKEGYQDSFYPRPEVVEYMERKKKLEEEIKFYKKHHTTSDYSESSYDQDGTTITLTSKELKDYSAFVADGLTNDQDCTTLQNLVKVEAINGDGYDYLTSKPSVISPHTEYETFIGLTVLRAASLAYHRQVTPEEVVLFLDLAEKGRFVVEKYFNLTRPLYFDFTHLVCRTAIEDEERDDLSHPVHADNCILQPDGTCLKAFPAFTQRDYSAILYLNDEFEGGEFFFAGSDKSEKQYFHLFLQVSVKPQCGRLVGFDSKEYHGVKAVTKGQRCALALWFTMNPNYKELAHSQA